MRIGRLLTTLIILIMTARPMADLCAWELITLFDVTGEGDQYKKPENFDPRNDIRFIPPLNSDFFQSIDDMSACRKMEVRKFMYLYLTRGRDFVKKAIKMSKLYKDIIDDIIQKNSDIPPDVSLLPILESGFNPKAVSRSRAVGLWQFVKNTSVPLGLKNDRWIDE